MRIIKPYGRSRTAYSPDGSTVRSLHTHLDPDRAVDIKAFASKHAELVLAQWISAIDKIVKPPKTGRFPGEQQWHLRTRLGDAAAALIASKQLIPGLDARGDDLRDRWEAKLHPYGERWIPAKDSGREAAALKGRWFSRFHPGDLNNFDAEAVALAIFEHLYVAEYRLGPKSSPKGAGKIAARAATIQHNVPGDRPAAIAEAWDGTAWSDYARAGNVAGAIRNVALGAYRAGRPMRLRMAAPLLHAHYAWVFPADEGGALPVAQARKRQPQLFAAHEAVRKTYRELLNGRRSDLGRMLPADMAQLGRLLEHRQRNKRTNALIRLGKVIHYSASAPAAADTTANVLDHWPGQTDTSRYWLSDGQAEIKRSEAFVRIWRGTIALAARTLSDWADPESHEGDDILGGTVILAITGQRFDDEAYRRKLPLLFGLHQDLFLGPDADANKAVLRFALQGLAGLRNAAFHFKGRGGFVHGIMRAHPEPNGALAAALAELWRRDSDDRPRVVKAALASSGCEAYLEQDQLEQVFAAYAEDAVDHAPIPRFQRVLHRVENAWGKAPWHLALPPAAGRNTLADPRYRCQYATLKALYERAFPAWLSSCNASRLDAYIERANARTTAAARAICDDPSVTARGDGLVRLAEGETVEDFLDRIAAATATEQRIQHSRSLDPVEARRQAKYLDDLRCDVVAQAFAAWLDEAGYAWVLALGADEGQAAALRSSVEKLPAGAVKPTVPSWALRLYFLLHLVPVGEIDKLRHQLRKWRTLDGGTTADADIFEQLLGLYVDVGSARFGMALDVSEAKGLEQLFEAPGDFEHVLHGYGEDGPRHHRGFREMLRFGDMSYMRGAFVPHPIKREQIDALGWAATETGGVVPIARAQLERERLHALWVEQGKLSAAELQRYRDSLDLVVWHRHLSSHVKLTDHLRVHQLAIAVLGRLLDFAGLWERDVYFAGLSLVQRSGEPVAELIDKPERLRTGEASKAFRFVKSNAGGKVLAVELGRAFGDIERSAVIRNELAHFKMLRSGAPLCLTSLVNRTRVLMSYDRKLRNAVSQSIIDLLARNGLDLAWSFSGQTLENARVASRQAAHLGGTKILENFHSRHLVGMVATLFSGTAIARPDVTSGDHHGAAGCAGEQRVLERIL